VLGYLPEPYPGLTPYAPPLMEQPLLAGAAEEAVFGAQPSGVVDTAGRAYQAGLPDDVLQMPYVSLDIGNRYSEDRVFAQSGPSWGMAHGTAAIQPALLPLHDSAAVEAVAGGSARALKGAPLLAERWLPRTESWAMQLSPEYVPALLSAPVQVGVWCRASVA
jgi:hypothetical protein